MRRTLSIVVLALGPAGCADDESPSAASDGGRSPDRASHELGVGIHDLAWTCLDGCPPLAFPPASYGRLDVSDELVLRWATDGSSNQLAVAGTEADGCVEFGALSYSEGATAPATFCAGAAGAEATIDYTGTSGPLVTRRYRVVATPRAE